MRETDNMKAPTIRDVARRAGVGVGTVSRVINGSSQVRESTRQRVLAVIDELGFMPNAAARQLSGGKSFTIGVVTAFFTFPSFVERLAGIQEVLEETDYELVLYSIRSPDQLQRQLRLLSTQNRVDGAIVLSLPFSEDEVRQAKPDLPLVVLDNPSIQHYPHTLIDNFRGGQMATEYLIAHGHRAIGFIGDPVKGFFGFTSTRERYQGFLHALAEAGLEAREAWHHFGGYTEQDARLEAQQVLSLEDRPTALFAATDKLAFGVLAAAAEMGLRVPDDLAVIGFDDIQNARHMQLTTVHQPLAESGRLGAQLLLDWLSDGPPPTEQWELELPLRIVERATV